MQINVVDSILVLMFDFLSFFLLSSLINSPILFKSRLSCAQVLFDEYENIEP